MSIKLKFCGGTRTVTGSMHLLKAGQSQVLIDGGLFQGRRDEFYRINTALPFNLPDINALLLSHAHIDHSGNIPNLVKQGLKSPIYATSATVDLCGLMLPDSGHIQEEDIRFVNKINKRKGLPAREPLYTEQDALNSLTHFRPFDYHQTFQPAPEISATFYEAGHVLGAAITVLDIKGNTHPIRLVYAVDLGRNNLPLLRDPEIIKNIDYLIIESTYGNKEHEPIETAKGRLTDTVSRTIRRGGKVIIPSFAFERTQEVVYFLTELIRKQKIPQVPIYVDSPLATDITMVFQQNIKYLDEKTQNQMRRQLDPFGFEYIKYIRSKDESQMLNDDRRPMIIISASGMCEAGRILHHLKNNIANPANTILIVGYMAQNTLGKKIVDKQPVVKIFGEEHQLKAEVVKINAFSAHADRNELLDYIRKSNSTIKRIFLVHGDDEQSQPFVEQLTNAGYKPYLPQKNEEVVIG
ncbi:MAG: MBL fold metallo-hydrolase [Planctomycetes bacterium]|nr:MBL fold metallo-hydrolase [Planctomycetota bacterium]